MPLVKKWVGYRSVPAWCNDGQTSLELITFSGGRVYFDTQDELEAAIESDGITGVNIIISRIVIT